MKRANQEPDYSLFDHQFGKAQDEAAKLSARRKLLRMTEDALRYHRIGLNTVAGKILRLVAKVAGLESLHRSREELATDEDVLCEKSSIPAAVRTLRDLGLLRRGITTDGGLITGLTIQVNFDEIHSASEKWNKSHPQVSEVWEARATGGATGSATGSATVSTPVSTPVAPTADTIYPSIPNSPSSPGSFEEVEVELTKLDIGQAKQAVESARQRGCDPNHIQALIEHYHKLLKENPRRWDSPLYALFARVSAASPKIPIERGWLSARHNPQDTSQAYRKAAREDLRSKIQVAPEQRATGFNDEERQLIASFGRRTRDAPS
ncbi:hypothetical protein VN12_20690 [Pirellula sp. SH-Sr6A]|uniref:hypothetical protein n=1 Tax=Pirellula sp. SH-Sr6A TaxID=1632865 RepID=UPI00078D6A6C|nr:hypothetical protein [Pirellula sp. SH-Sr6A]AMV34554.1 hypothetical protein VN12_20690 [Pirellula sp. SH-Sr6A]